MCFCACKPGLYPLFSEMLLWIPNLQQRLKLLGWQNSFLIWECRWTSLCFIDSFCSPYWLWQATPKVALWAFQICICSVLAIRILLWNPTSAIISASLFLLEESIDISLFLANSSWFSLCFLFHNNFYFVLMIVKPIFSFIYGRE